MICMYLLSSVLYILQSAVSAEEKAKIAEKVAEDSAIAEAVGERGGG